MSKENKATNIEYEQRMDRAFELMLYEKKSYKEFAEIFSSEYNISKRQAENVWADVRNRLKERFTQNQEEILQEQLNRYFDLLKRAREDRNKRVERETLADINKLLGLEAIKKVDLTSNGESIQININLD